MSDAMSDDLDGAFRITDDRLGIFEPAADSPGDNDLFASPSRPQPAPPPPPQAPFVLDAAAAAAAAFAAPPSVHRLGAFAPPADSLGGEKDQSAPPTTDAPPPPPAPQTSFGPDAAARFAGPTPAARPPAASPPPLRARRGRTAPDEDRDWSWSGTDKDDDSPPASPPPRAPRPPAVAGAGPCVCGECGLSFGGAGVLSAHRRLHTGETPFPCPHDCGKSFRWRSSLAFHEATAHEAALSVSPRR